MAPQRDEQMEITEIILLAAGGIIFILSFLIPEGRREVSEQSKDLAKEEIADMVGREMESIRGHVDDVVEEAVTYAMEKTERSLERLSNEKIMAVSDYSDTVLSEIHKNHEEAMFLYDMLNSKHTNLKNTVSEVNRTVKEAEEKVGSISRLADAAAVVQLQRPVETGLERAAVRPVGVREQAASVQPASMPALSGGPSSGLASFAAPVSSIAPSYTAAAPVPSASVPAEAVPLASMPASSVPLASMSLPTAVSAAGRVSFLQEGAQDGRNNNDRILELYRHGKSKVAIAKELGLGVGEVKLVIDLFQHQ